MKAVWGEVIVCCYPDRLLHEAGVEMWGGLRWAKHLDLGVMNTAWKQHNWWDVSVGSLHTVIRLLTWTLLHGNCLIINHQPLLLLLWVHRYGLEIWYSLYKLLGAEQVWLQPRFKWVKDYFLCNSLCWKFMPTCFFQLINLVKEMEYTYYNIFFLTALNEYECLQHFWIFRASLAVWVFLRQLVWFLGLILCCY